VVFLIVERGLLGYVRSKRFVRGIEYLSLQSLGSFRLYDRCMKREKCRVEQRPRGEGGEGIGVSLRIVGLTTAPPSSKIK